MPFQRLVNYHKKAFFPTIIADAFRGFHTEKKTELCRKIDTLSTLSGINARESKISCTCSQTIINYNIN